MKFQEYTIQLQDGKYNMIYTICADSVEQAFKRICDEAEPYYNPEWGYKQLNTYDYKKEKGYI